MSTPQHVSLFTVKVDNEPDIRFSGALLAQVSSMLDKDGSTRQRWTELSLYKLFGSDDRYVVAQVGCSRKEGEVNRHDAKVAYGQREVIEYFGHGALAKRLYAAAGIEDIVEVK